MIKLKYKKPTENWYSYIDLDALIVEYSDLGDEIRLNTMLDWIRVQMKKEESGVEL